jgi:hypothetical protein
MLLVGCTSAAQDQSAQDATEAFYKSYLSAFGSDDVRPYPADELRKYVSADTIARIDAIQDISEQELIESDYFTYTQDYSREWIPALRVENARPFLNGEVVQVLEERLAEEAYTLKYFFVVKTTHGKSIAFVT